MLLTGILVLSGVLGFVLASNVQPQNRWYAMTFNCPSYEPVSLMPGSWPPFPTAEEAKAYADPLLDSGEYVISYVQPFGGGAWWIRATGDCYNGMFNDWTLME